MSTTAINQNAVLRFMRDRLEGYAVAQFPEYKPGRHHRLLVTFHSPPSRLNQEAGIGGGKIPLRA